MATQLSANTNPESRNQRIFERELQPLMDAIFSFAFRLTSDKVQADDLVQETYLKAWRFLDKYHEGTNAKAWLFRICRNAFINDYRDLRNQPYMVDYGDLVKYHNEDDPAMPRYNYLHEEFGNQLMGDEVSQALSNLSDDFRVVVLLDLEDFTYEEIANIINIPIGTVRSRLHRARKILAEKLREYAENQGYAKKDENGASDQTEVPHSA